MHSAEAEDTMRSFRREYLNALRAAGYASTLEDELNIAIDYTLEKLKPLALYHRTTDIIGWRKKENFREENFNRFIGEADMRAKRNRGRTNYVPLYESRAHKEKKSSFKKTHRLVERKQPLFGTGSSVNRQQAENYDVGN